MNLLNQMEMADSKTLNSYEYAMESISSASSGRTQKEEMLRTIKRYTEDGWRVHTIYSNELGKNAVAFMGVGVNSTQSEDIIIFEKHIQYNVICYTEKDLLVTNYCGDLPVRFGMAKMIIPKNTDSFWFSITGKYGNGITMEAFRVDAEFITIFDERVPIKNISFITINREQSNFVTEQYEVSLNKNEIRLIKAVKIYVKSYVANGKAYSFNDLKYVDVNDDKLTLIQKDIYGQEYFRKYTESGNDWTCVCGKVNDNTIECCPICGRNRSSLKNNEKIDLTRIFDEAENKKSAKEIYDWLTKYNEESCNEIISNMLEELKKVIEIERFYGNSKKSAIDIIYKRL